MNHLLVIDDTIKAQIRAMIAAARLRPVSRETLLRYGKPASEVSHELTLEDRKDVPNDGTVVAQHTIMICNHYRCDFSFEDQPKLGLCRHLSVSVPDAGKSPTVPAMQMLADAFGFRWSGDDFIRAPELEFWTEEFRPGHHAVNVLQVGKLDE